MMFKQKADKIIEILISYGVKDKEQAQKCFVEIINCLTS